MASMPWCLLCQYLIQVTAAILLPLLNAVLNLNLNYWCTLQNRMNAGLLIVMDDFGASVLDA